MDAELAQSAIDDAFEGLGTPDCRYEPPGGGPPVEGLVLIVHRPSTERVSGGVSFENGRMNFESDVKPTSIIVRVTDLPDPAENGIFVVAARRYRIGETPVENDAHGLSLRCRAVSE